MLSDTEAAELRALQKKAYGRASGVSIQDLERLHTLEGRAQRAAPVTPAVSTAPEVISEVPGSLAAEAPASVAGEQIPNEADAPRGSSGPQTLLRSRWWVLAGSVVIAGGAGMLLGWSLAAEPHGDRIRVSAAEEQRRDAFYDSGSFDSGSILALGRDGQTVAWSATRTDGEMICLIVDDDTAKGTNCLPREEYELSGIWTSYTPGDAAEEGEMVHAQLFRDLEGIPRAQLQRVPVPIDSYLNNFDHDDRLTAEWLLSQGADERSGEIAGRVGEDPIWLATRQSGQQLCLLYAPNPPVARAACAAYADIGDEGLSVWVSPDQPADAGAVMADQSTIRQIQVIPDNQRRTPIMIRELPRSAVDGSVALTEPVEDLEDAVHE